MSKRMLAQARIAVRDFVSAIGQREEGPTWAEVVGRLVLASGALEYRVLHTIVAVSNEKVGRAALEMPHARRLSLLEALVSEQDEKTAKGVASIVASLRAFNEKRNFVAHNSLMLELGKDGSRGAIISVKNVDRRIYFDELAALADEGEGLVRGFYMAWMFATGKLPFPGAPDLRKPADDIE